MAISRSALLSDSGNAGAGRGKLKTATSSPPRFTRDARSPNGAIPASALEARPSLMPFSSRKDSNEDPRCLFTRASGGSAFAHDRARADERAARRFLPR
jgi:hypothetical protein